MEKEMTEINISIRKGYIFITQPIPMHHDDAEVAIHPDQVDLVVKWLEEAKAEIESNP